MVAYYKRKPKAPTRSTQATITKNRKTNYAVKKALMTPRPKTTNKLTKYKNYNAITTLARQVRSLQMKDYGSVQYTRQVITTNSGQKDITGLGSLLRGAPYLFELKNFYGGARIWKGDMDGTLTPSSQQTHRWLPIGTGGVLGSGAPWVFDYVQDTPSHIQYMPLTAFYQFHVKFNDVEAGKDKTLKLSVFRLTNRQDHQNPLKKTDPIEYLGAYGQMSAEDPSDRNRFSPVLHKVLYEREYHIKNTGDQTKDVERYINMKWSFSGKDGLVRLDTDQIDGSPTSTTQDYCAVNFKEIIAPQDQIFVLISTNNNDQTIRGELSCMRTLRWRDNNGVISR